MDAESYKSRFMGYMNGSVICEAVEIARESGILQLFIDPHQPMTVEEIATKTKSKPRYVKEILGCLATGLIVEIDENSEKYFVPDEIRPILHSFSISNRLIDFVHSIKKDVISVLDVNGPKGYSAQSKPGFGEALTERRKFDMESLIESEIFTSTPELKEKLESGASFVEYGCGEGIISLILAKQYPKSQFTGSDYSDEALAILQRNIDQEGLTNIQAANADLYNLPSDWTEKFDIAFVRDTLHDLGDPVKSVEEIVRTVKTGGWLSITEVIVEGDNLRERRKDPKAPLLYFFSSSICVPESLCQEGGLGLGCTSGEKNIKRLLAKGGIPEEAIKCYPLPKSPFNIRLVYHKI